MLLLRATATWHNPGVSSSKKASSAPSSEAALLAQGAHVVMWPTANKLRGYAAWRRGKTVLVNFHPRKTSGSTICEVAIENGAFPLWHLMLKLNISNSTPL